MAGNALDIIAGLLRHLRWIGAAREPLLDVLLAPIIPSQREPVITAEHALEVAHVARGPIDRGRGIVHVNAVARRSAGNELGDTLGAGRTRQDFPVRTALAKPALAINLTGEQVWIDAILHGRGRHKLAVGTGRHALGGRRKLRRSLVV